MRTLRRAPRVIDGLFLRTMNADARLALGRYGARAASLAMREQSADILRGGLLASAMVAVARSEDDRDLMVGLALHFYCAQRLGVAPDTLFSEVADRIADPHTADLLRKFGSRTDVTLDAFGWKLVEPSAGPDFELP